MISFHTRFVYSKDLQVLYSTVLRSVKQMQAFQSKGKTLGKSSGNNLNQITSQNQRSLDTHLY